ncbi:MAG: DNA recombination protein RmuC [Saprospiraceae bacterium]
MELIYIFLLVIAVLLIVNIFLTLKAGKKEESTELAEIKNSVASLIQNLKDTEANLKSEFATNRKENADSLKSVREEVGNQLNSFTKTFSENLSALTKSNEEKLEAIRKSIEEKLSAFQNGIETANKDSRKELKETLNTFKTEVNNSLKDFGERQRNNFTDLLQNLNTQNVAATAKLDSIRETVEKKIGELQNGNELKLEEMRKTVDEKLNETLEKRLGESFKLVSERLEAVHKGLGDMQNLAKDVGNLNKTMNNVKSRGILGEYQLHNLLEDLLTNEQYEQNVKTKVGSGAVVEFAVKMPNGNNIEKTLWLPIDSKFPKEDYEALVDAYDKGEVEKLEGLRKAFAKSIRKNAQDIKEKYIDPPNTTEYGVMFLPYESLYAEVLRTPGLFEQLQKDYKITIAGPTTLSAFLNSLQMGFRTLAIEKRSSEVWDLLGAVKTEFGKFGDVLAKTKRKLMEATSVIEDSETRTRVIERKLKHVQILPQDKAISLLDSDVLNDKNESNEKDDNL